MKDTFAEIFDNVQIVIDQWITEQKAKSVLEHRLLNQEVGRALISYGAALYGGAHDRKGEEIVKSLERFLSELRQ